MKKNIIVVGMLLVCMSAFAVEPFFDFNAGGTFPIVISDNNGGIGMGGFMQIGLGLDFENGTGLAILAEGAVGAGTFADSWYFMGGILSEFLLFDGYLGLGCGLNWDSLGFNVKPTVSTRLGGQVKFSLGVPIYSHGVGFSLSIGFMGSGGLAFLQGFSEGLSQ